ncbi:type II secretion system F family protein [Clostridium sp. AM58-1XD]|uniref:type II secretion system F family protein n=1 Tax=Clostridium sp. AM58-1XD TaxID=2292307 RepID=UPI000E4FBEF2|nr:type II secretion system F family protein [Clostridium sp. AM58-1XD]RGZ01878.1 kinase [Clostridium sp. AM58-1XD]
MKKKKSIYVEIPGLAGSVTDYHVYHMTRKEKRTGALAGGILGFLVIYIFFAQPVVSLICAVLTSRMGIRVYGGRLKEKRDRMLAIEFRDMLEAVSTSLGAGKNIVDSFSEAYGDMDGQYGKDSYICRELEAIMIGINNNIRIEDLLMNFGQRSGNEDIQSFADVFTAANRAGGDIREIIFETKNVISDKMAIELEIQTLVSGKKSELNIMIVLPFIVVSQLRGMNNTGGDLGSILIDTGVKILVLILFAGAYIMGQKMIKIRI